MFSYLDFLPRRVSRLLTAMPTCEPEDIQKLIPHVMHFSSTNGKLVSWIQLGQKRSGTFGEGIKGLPEALDYQGTAFIPGIVRVTEILFYMHVLKSCLKKESNMMYLIL